jgi:hypothetical protein
MCSLRFNDPRVHVIPVNNKKNNINNNYTSAYIFNIKLNTDTINILSHTIQILISSNELCSVIYEMTIIARGISRRAEL